MACGFWYGAGYIFLGWLRVCPIFCCRRHHQPHLVLPPHLLNVSNGGIIALMWYVQLLPQLLYITGSGAVAAAVASASVCPASDADAMRCAPAGDSLPPDNYTAPNATMCCQLCVGDSHCKGWIYNPQGSKKSCHLKGRTSDIVRAAGGVLCGAMPVVPTPAPPAPPKGAKNVLFIVSDDFRPSTGAYGTKEASTPHLDALAAGGILFTAAHVQFAYCAPSRNSFMSGRRVSVQSAVPVALPPCAHVDSFCRGTSPTPPRRGTSITTFGRRAWAKTGSRCPSSSR